MAEMMAPPQRVSPPMPGTPPMQPQGAQPGPPPGPAPQMPPLEPEPPEIKMPPPEPPAIAKEFSDKETRDRAVKNAMDSLEEWARWREANVEPVWKAVNACYRGLAPKNKGPYNYVYVIREGFRHIETMKPLVEEALLGEDNFKYQARTPGLDDEMEGATAIVKDQRQRFEITQAEKRAIVASTLMWGVGYINTGWRSWKLTRFKKEVSWNPTDNDTWWDSKTEEFNQDGPFGEVMLPWNCYTHPLIEDPRESPYFFHHQLLTGPAVKTLVREGYLDKKAVKEAAEENSKARGLDIERWLSPDNKDEDLVELLGREAEPLDFIQCWTNDGWELVILEGKWLLRAQKLYDGRMPIYCWRNYPQDQQHYGIPELVIILDEQHLLNDIMGMFVDGIHITVNPMFTVRSKSQDAFNKLIWKPGGKLIVQDSDDVKPLAVNPAVINLTQVADWIRGNMRAADSTTNEVSGLQSNTGTATEYRGTLQAASVRIRGKVRDLVPETRRFYLGLYALNARYLTDEQTIRISGPEGKNVFRNYSPAIFNADADVEVKLANEVPTGAEQANQWALLYKAAAGDPALDHTKILERWIRALGEKPKEFIVNPALSHTDALSENQDCMAYGALPDPKSSDNHQVHMQIHYMAYGLMRQQPPGKVRKGAVDALYRHMMVHLDYMRAQEQAMNQAGMAVGQNPAPSKSQAPEQDMATEAQSNNAGAGAAQQGALPGPSAGMPG